MDVGEDSPQDAPMALVSEGPAQGSAGEEPSAAAAKASTGQVNTGAGQPGDDVEVEEENDDADADASTDSGEDMEMSSGEPSSGVDNAPSS